MSEIQELKELTVRLEKKAGDYDWLAQQYVNLDSLSQARFFMAVAEKFADMRGGVACMQNAAIADDMCDVAKGYVANLAEHIRTVGEV